MLGVRNPSSKPTRWKFSMTPASKTKVPVAQNCLDAYSSEPSNAEMKLAMVETLVNDEQANDLPRNCSSSASPLAVGRLPSEKVAHGA